MKRFTMNLAVLMLVAVVLLAGCTKSNEKQIRSFCFYNPEVEAMIMESEKTITASMPCGTDVTALEPVITISEKASVNPASGLPQDFTNPVIYTVTAEDGTQAFYTVTVTVEDDGDNDDGGNDGGETHRYTIDATAFPYNAGTVSGGGAYESGQRCTLTAIPNSGYTFVSWAEGINEVSTDANYTFTVSRDRNLTANFAYECQEPTGAIKGKFSVNANGDMVYFSQGNLQYNAYYDTWRFAQRQWDYIGGIDWCSLLHYGNMGNSSINNNVSPTYAGWIDLFGWGTSGWDCGNTYYHPWDNENDIEVVDDEVVDGGKLYGPPGCYDLTGEYAYSDWGRYNTISNSDANWRTLTIDEWAYVFTMRRTHCGIRFATAIIRGENAQCTCGIILLPDDWSESYYMLYETDDGSASYENNLIDITDWNNMEAHGAVFLPLTGYRTGDNYCYHSDGSYWSASCIHGDNSRAYCVYFDENGVGPMGAGRWLGMAVRLVSPAGN